MKIGVLALQGAFAEHEKVLEQLGAECIELRQARDLSEPYDALVRALSQFSTFRPSAASRYA